MRLSRFAAIALSAIAFATAAVAATYYATANYQASGSDWEIGGTLNVQSGGVLSINGADVTSKLAASVANPVAGAASGYKVAQGETALDGSNPTPVATGLATITACTLTIKTASAPGVSTSVVTYGSSGGTLNMYGWKPTSNADPTLIASTGTDTIGWLCFGT